MIIRPSFTRTPFPGGFLGDIALPNVRYEMEWDLQKANKSYIDEIEKYRKEVLHEGLQVEEEGLVGIHHKKLAGTSSSRQNGTLGILKEGQERARNRMIPKPKNKTLVEEKTEVTPVLLMTTLKPVAFSTETTRRLTGEEESTTTTATPASPAATDSVDSTKPTQKAKHEKKSENRNRRPHRQRKNKNRRRKNRRRKKQKQE